MKHDTKLMLTAVGFAGALGDFVFWGVKRAHAAPAQPQAPQPQPTPFAVPKAPIPEIHVSPNAAPATADIPPEQWTQEQASEVTAYQGNEARETIGKVFGF